MRVSFVVLSLGDIGNIFAGRISGKQLFKNLTNTASSVAGGGLGWTAGAAAGAAIGSVIPIVGTAAGGVIGGLLGAFGEFGTVLLINYLQQIAPNANPDKQTAELVGFSNGKQDVLY